VEQVHTAAAMEEFPFTCTIEPAWVKLVLLFSFLDRNIIPFS
jgi:hypothetical protein